MIVVMPEASASSTICGQMRCTWQSIAPAVRILPLPREDLGRRADHQRRVDAVHRVGVAGLADADDAPVADADVGLDDAPVVEDHRAGDHEVGRALGAACGCDCPIDSRITLPPPNTASSPPTQQVAARPRSAGRCRPGGCGRRWSARRAGGSASRRISTIEPPVEPSATSPRRPATMPVAADRHERRPSRSMPGSKRTDVPGRRCRAGARAPRRGRTRSAGLASAKW